MQCWSALSFLFSSLKLFAAVGAVGAVAVADLGAVMAAVAAVAAAAAVEANNPDAPGEVAAAETTKTDPLNAQEKR